MGMLQVIGVHHGEGFICQQKAEQETPACRQMADMRQQSRRVQHVAQVNDEGGHPDHQQAHLPRRQADGDELTGAGKHTERHQLPLPRRQRTGRSQGAENHAERCGAYQHRQGISGASGKTGQGGGMRHKLFLCDAGIVMSSMALR